MPAPLSPVDIARADTLIVGDERAASIAREQVPDRSFAERYAEIGALGEGGMGVVKLYRDQRIGRSVAIKELHPKLAGSVAGHARFVREAKLQGQLEHPAIVPVYDLGLTEDGAAYFSMKRVRGVTLEEILVGLRNGESDMHERFSLRRLLTAFSSVCLAIQFTHQRGVFHRDLKPANIMLGDYGEVYVLDWGIAKVRPRRERVASNARVDVPLAEEATTRPGMMFGTPGYLAPEQVMEEERYYGPESDVYSLGTILFELLTLQRLHEVDSLNQLVAMLSSKQEVRPSQRAPERDIPPELEAICMRACAFEPSERYDSARVLSQAIDDYLEGQRDLTLRAELAREHASRAQAAAERACSDADSLDERRRAMQEIGRALALDPDNAEAMQTLEQLLREPPPVLPPEVQLEMSRTSALRHRRTARIGAIAYASLLLYLPLLMWLGIRDPRPLYAMYALALGCVLISLYASRLRRASVVSTMAVMVLSNIMFACTSFAFGPLIMLPTILVANTMSFTIHLDGAARKLAVVSGCLAVAVPVALEMTGVVQPSYRFQDGVMDVTTGLVSLEQGAMWLLALVSLTAILTGAVVVARVRDALREAEQRVYTYAWHLREFVPQAVRAPTDPTVARHAR